MLANLFSKLRNLLWPIYGSENRRVLSAGLMMALSVWNYGFSRGAKDAFINLVAGTEALPLVKIFAVIPMTMIMLNFYNSLMKTRSFTETFYIVHSVFVGFFFIFAFVLYPFRYYLHMSPTTIKYWQTFVYPMDFLPHFLGFAIASGAGLMVLMWLFKVTSYKTQIAGFVSSLIAAYSYFYYPEWSMQPFQFGVYKNLDVMVPIVGNWSYTLFYGFSELTGTVTLTLFSWQILNKVSTTSEAKRFFPAAGILANVVGGIIGIDITNMLIKAGAKSPELIRLEELFKNKTITPDQENTLYYLGATSNDFMLPLIGLFVVCLLQMPLYRWIDKNIISSFVKEESTKKEKVKLSNSESFGLIFSSRYLLFLFFIILCYNSSIVPLENVWKNQLRAFYTNTAEYASYTNAQTWYTSLITVISMLVSVNILRYISWTTGALITPLLATIFLVPFFGLQLAPEIFIPFFSYFFDMSTSFMIGWIAVQSGTAGIICSKSVKYAFFDGTKEMAYIPASEEIKTKGKAAVDMIGGRFGKALGSLFLFYIQVIRGMKYNNLVNGNPTLWITCFATIIYFIWFVSIFFFSKEYYKALEAQNNKAELKNV